MNVTGIEVSSCRHDDVRRMLAEIGHPLGETRFAEPLETTCTHIARGRLLMGNSAVQFAADPLRREGHAVTVRQSSAQCMLTIECGDHGALSLAKDHGGVRLRFQFPPSKEKALQACTGLLRGGTLGHGAAAALSVATTPAEWVAHPDVRCMQDMLQTLQRT